MNSIFYDVMKIKNASKFKKYFDQHYSNTPVTRTLKGNEKQGRVSKGLSYRGRLQNSICYVTDFSALETSV